MTSPKYLKAVAIKEGEWILVTKKLLRAYVIDVIDDRNINVGYLQNGVKAIKDECVLSDGVWEFKCAGPSGSYLRGPLEDIVRRGPYKT